jgi:hypothetical protein
MMAGRATTNFFRKGYNGCIRTMVTVYKGVERICKILFGKIVVKLEINRFIFELPSYLMNVGKSEI